MDPFLELRAAAFIIPILRLNCSAHLQNAIILRAALRIDLFTKMVLFGGKNGLANFHGIKLHVQTVLGRKISFQHCFRKSVMFGLRFFAFKAGLK